PARGFPGEPHHQDRAQGEVRRHDDAQLPAPRLFVDPLQIDRRQARRADDERHAFLQADADMLQDRFGDREVDDDGGLGRPYRGPQVVAAPYAAHVDHVVRFGQAFHDGAAHAPGVSGYQHSVQSHRRALPFRRKPHPPPQPAANNGRRSAARQANRLAFGSLSYMERQRVKGTVPSAVGFDFGGAVLLQNAGGVFGAVVVVRFYDAQNAALLHVLFILPAAILGNAQVQQSPADASRHRARQRRGQRPRGDDGPDAGNRQGAHAG